MSWLDWYMLYCHTAVWAEQASRKYQCYDQKATRTRNNRTWLFSFRFGLGTTAVARRRVRLTLRLSGVHSLWNLLLRIFRSDQLKFHLAVPVTICSHLGHLMTGLILVSEHWLLYSYLHGVFIGFYVIKIQAETNEASSRKWRHYEKVCAQQWSGRCVVGGFCWL